MKQKLLVAFFVGIFSFFVSSNFALAELGASCLVNDNTGSHSGICQASEGNTCNYGAYPGRQTPCGSSEEICCFDSVPAAPVADTGYTDPTPVSGPAPVVSPVDTGGTTGGASGGTASSGGASCMKFGVHGVCIDINDPNQEPCSSDIIFSGVCSGGSFRCCPTEAVPQNVRTAIENGTIPSDTLLMGSPCTLTTNEAGACITRDDCRALGTGSSDVEPCTSKGMVCCRTGTSGGSSGGSSGNGGGSPLPKNSGGGSNGGAGNTGGTSGGTGSNRSGVNTGGTGSSTAKGLYIPRGSDIGLSEVPVTSLIQNLMLWLLYIVGFVAIIAFVISGIQYLLAGASEEMAKKAKANMQYAIIGVVVALSALIIIRAVQSVLSGAWIF